MKALRWTFAVAVFVAVAAAAAAQIPVGTRVTPELAPSGYEDGGRRDPFVSLVVAKKPTPGQIQGARVPSGLPGIAIADVKLRGITKVGDKYMAMIEGPDKRSYTAHVQDRLLDGFVKSVDALGIVLVEQDSAGRTHEVRKALRQAAEVAIR
jgi:Tfp pilus assembly protein PilP